MPRHPPCTLNSLTTNIQFLPREPQRTAFQPEENHLSESNHI